MRGQESGSEHERATDGSAVPATPPPSFGRPSSPVPRTDPIEGERPGTAPPEPAADRPWTAPGDDAASYDPPSSEAGPAAPAPGAPSATGPGAPEGSGAPDAPAWQPPPAFTAAAAGMRVWPSPASDAPGIPAWPAATGEPVEELSWPDSDEEIRPGASGGAAARPSAPPEPGSQEDTSSPPSESQENTVDIRVPAPGAPEPQEPVSAASAAPEPRESAPSAADDRPGPPPAAPAGPTAPSSAPVPPPAGPVPVSPPPMTASTPPSPVPAAPADPPAPLPVLADQPTPPRGFPPVPPPLPLPPGPPGARPSDGPAVERGPFEPPSATAPPAPPPAPASPGRGRLVLAAAAVAVVVGGIGTGAFFAYRSFNADTTPPPAAPAVSAPASESPVDIPTEELIDTTMLNSELTDPGKMTVADAFAKKLTLSGTTFTRVKTHLAQDCDKAATGAFATALKNGDCRRVLRATYVDRKKKYAVTTGIAVLPTRESAVKVDQAKDLGKNLWFRGLRGSEGTGAERMHIAGGYAAGLVWGRYIVFSYATFADGHTPTAKEKSLGRLSGAFRDQTAKVVERRLTR
ncbi:hypothetical protein GCM10010466_09590 [Planomonospora alba]|uniref:Uncharacterized protein n=1 Tax=Planomonospora alba TaxID=161354 RepID=A0ABP6MNR6_9ACTN